MSDSNENNMLFTISQQQADTQRFLGRIESSLEAIQHQYNQTNENLKISFDTLNKRISDTNTMISTSLQEIKTEREHHYAIIMQHQERLESIERDREKTKGIIHAAKIILGLLGTMVTAIAGFLVNFFMKSGG